MSLSVSSKFYKFFGVATMFYTYRFTFAVSQKLIIRLIWTLDIYSLVANRWGGGGVGVGRIVGGWKIFQIFIGGGGGEWNSREVGKFSKY